MALIGLLHFFNATLETALLIPSGAAILRLCSRLGQRNQNSCTAKDGEAYFLDLTRSVPDYASIRCVFLLTSIAVLSLVFYTEESQELTNRDERRKLIG